VRNERDDRQSGSDLATMLAEMDSRLQRLQQELESVALPIARSPSEQLRAKHVAAPAEADLDGQDVPEGAPTAHPSPLGSAATAAATVEAELLSTPPRRPARRVTATSRQAPPPAPPEPAAPERQARPSRRGGAPTFDADPASRLLPTPAPVSRRPAASQPADSSAPEAVVRQTILEAEDEARKVVEDARQRIAEIGARTRALLEHSLTDQTPAEPATTPRRRRARAVKAARRAYEGTVIVEAGPFADVAQLSSFEDALGAIPSVDDVYIRTFERNRAHFELNVTEPTALIVELQARSAETLNVVASGDGELRLDIVRGAA
jgi:hypothetical protein